MAKRTRKPASTEALQREAKIGELLAAQMNSACKCGRAGDHVVCAKCGAHADRGAQTCTTCGAKSSRYSSPMVATTPGRLSAWDVEFLYSVRGKGDRCSPKMLAVYERIVARALAPATVSTTADRDAIACCPRSGRTFAAICEAIGWQPVCPAYGGGPAYQAGWPSEELPDRETMTLIRAAFRALVSDVTGWDSLPNTEAFSDALRVVDETAPLGKALRALLDYHAFMVRTGRFQEAA